MAFVTKPGTWLLDRTPTDDPYWLQIQLDELEVRVKAAFDAIVGGGDVFDPTALLASIANLQAQIDTINAAAGTQTVGKTSIGVTASPISGNHSYVNKRTLPATGSLTSLKAYVDGNAVNTGTQRLRIVLFADSGGVPAALVGSSLPVTVTHSDAPALKAFSGSIAVPAAGDYWFGLAAEVGGTSTNQVARYYTDAGAAGSLVYNTDTGLVGTVASTFGAVSGSTTELLSVQGTFTATAGITGVTVQDEGAQQGSSAAITTFNFVGPHVAVSAAGSVATVTQTDQTVSSSGSASGADTVTLVNFPLPASASYASDPIATNGKLLSVSAVADQTISSLILYDSADALTKRFRATPSAVAAGGNSIVNATIPVVRPYAHIALSNSTTDQTSLEIARTLA